MTVPVVRKRAKHSKTRSGCRTCRQRHVKCDEARPFCNTCTISNRACGGYDFVPLPSSSKPRKLVAATALQKGPIVATIDLTAFESAAFDYFRLFTVNQLPQTSWWQHLVLDLGRQEPALAHTAVALGSMHRSLTSCSQSLDAQTQQGFADEQYSKAMGLMRQYIEKHQKCSKSLSEQEIVVVLLASLLFFCLESYMGRDEQATMHLRTGLKILYEHIHGPSPPPSPDGCCEDRAVTTTTSMRSYLDALKYTFILMDSDLNMVDEEEPYLQTTCIDRLPLAFQNVQSAHIHLDGLATRANLVWRELLTICEGYFEDHPEICEDLDDETEGFLLGCMSRIVPIDPDDPFLANYETMRQDLRNWLNAWATVPMDDSNRSDHLLCQIFFFYVWYRVETWRDATEMRADRFEEQFSHITNLAEQYLILHQTPARYLGSSTQTYTTPPLFSFGTGFITAVMVIAIKCRTSSVRRRCINITRKINLQGVFDSAYLAAYLEKIQALEEQRARDTFGHPHSKTSFEADDIGEEARLFEPMMLPGSHLNQTTFYTSKSGKMIFAEFSNGPGSDLIIQNHDFKR